MRIMLADDQVQVRSALKLLLEQEAGLAVVAEVAEAEDLQPAVEASSPDLLLLDWELPGRQAGDVVRTLREQYPDLVIVPMSGRPEASSGSLAAGAHAFVSKGDPPERLLSTVLAFDICECRDCRCR